MKNLKTRGSLIENYTIVRIDATTINLSIKIKDDITYTYEICSDDRFPDINVIEDDIKEQIEFAKSNFKTFTIERYSQRDYIFVKSFNNINDTFQYTGRQLQ